MKHLSVVFLFILLFFTSCTKEDKPDWKFCDGCPNQEGVGVYEGTGAFFSKNIPDITKEVALKITIDSLPDFRLNIVVSSPNNFYASYNGVKSDSAYFFDLGGSEKSIHLNLHKSDADYKLFGNAKTYYVEHDTVKLDKSISFEILKNRQ